MIKPRKAVIDMEEYNPPTSGRENFLRLDFNENTKGCSAQVLKVLKNIKADYLSIYPEYSELRKALAGYCKVSLDNVMPTNATDEAIKTVIETYVEKGKDEVIIPTPTFAMFKFYAQLNEAVVREVLYNEDLRFPTGKVLSAINQKTKLVVLVNPNSPTGTSIVDEDIIKIIKKSGENDALVLIDEAYFQFYGKTSIPLIKKYDNVIVMQTFSKAFGLAGFRLGYIISNKSNIKNIQKVISPYSVNSIAVASAFAALNDQKYIKDYVTEVNKSKELFYRSLDSLKVKYFKSDANFVLLSLEKKADSFCRQLKQEGILVRDRSMDKLLYGCVRVTLGTLEQTKRLIYAINNTIGGKKQLLIFDIDGVLVDVSKSYRVAIKQTVKAFTGKEITLEEIQALKNKGGYNNDWDASKQLIKDRGKNIDRKAIIRKFQGFYEKLMDNEPLLIDKKLLKNLSNKYTLALFTGRDREETDYVLRVNDIKKYFSMSIAMEDVTSKKPDPEGLLKIINNFRISDAYYFGDMIDDMQAAKAAGITPVGVLPPQDKSENMKNLLVKNGAQSILDNINQIKKVLENQRIFSITKRYVK
jgi:histidinol-phosphate aminotransferase